MCEIKWDIILHQNYERLHCKKHMSDLIQTGSNLSLNPSVISSESTQTKIWTNLMIKFDLKFTQVYFYTIFVSNLNLFSNISKIDHIFFSMLYCIPLIRLFNLNLQSYIQIKKLDFIKISGIRLRIRDLNFDAVPKKCIPPDYTYRCYISSFLKIGP